MSGSYDQGMEYSTGAFCNSRGLALLNLRSVAVQ